MRIATYGRQPTEKPKHALAEVHFPQLAKLDEGTKEGFISRVLTSDGADTRALPRTIYFQKTQEGGHDGSVAVGALHEVTVDGENNILSGKGWLLDSAEGRDAALHIAGQALFHNSVDLAEVDVEIIDHGDFFDDDYVMEVRFTQWKLGATTLVGKPAFADAHAILPDELTAAIESGPLVVDAPFAITLQVEAPDEEIAASGGGLPPWDYFHRPEPDQHHKIIVGEPDEAGFIPVYGHLGLWNSCHDGIEGRCVMIPRPQDNYASFNKPGVLTDRGIVETGPISLYGGHIPLHKAADDPANAWCDVRVTAGVHGPWLSGVVRPGVALDEAKVYVARASRISGHWKGGRLKMIVSCNSEGFDVPGSGFSFSTTSDGHVGELVASYPACSQQDVDDPPVDSPDAAAEPPSPSGHLPSFLLQLEQLSPEQQDKVRQAAASGHPAFANVSASGANGWTSPNIYIHTGDTFTPDTYTIPAELIDRITQVAVEDGGDVEQAIDEALASEEFVAEIERERRKRVLALRDISD